MTFNNSADNTFDLEVDATAREHLRSITSWARIIALIGFINTALSLVGLIKAGPEGGAFAIALVFGLVFVAIMVMIYLFLLRFANHTAASLQTDNQEGFNYGIDSLRSYFKIIGILLIIVVSLVCLGFLLFGLGVAMRG